METPRNLGPARAGPRCFVLLASSNFWPIDHRIGYLRGAVFMSDDATAIGDIIRIAGHRSDYSGAFQAVIAAGWSLYAIPGSAIRVSSLNMTIQAGDPWAAVVYNEPVVGTPGRRKHIRGVSVPAEVKPATLYSGIAPVTDNPTVDNLPRAMELSKLFFPLLIATNSL